jgi:hypothetical protein
MFERPQIQILDYNFSWFENGLLENMVERFVVCLVVRMTQPDGSGKISSLDFWFHKLKSHVVLLLVFSLTGVTS